MQLIINAYTLKILQVVNRPLQDLPNPHYHLTLILMEFMDIVMKIQAPKIQINNIDIPTHHGSHGTSMEHQEHHAQTLDHYMNISMMLIHKRHFMLTN